MLVYKDLLEIAKSEGIRVYHGKRKYGSGTALAHNERNNHWIHIRSKLKNTLRGCYILAHELGHYVDAIDNRFPGYHRNRKYRFKPLPKSYVRRMEWSASMFGKKLVEISGLDICHFPDFDKWIFENDPDFMPWWIEYYNVIRIKENLSD